MPQTPLPTLDFARNAVFLDIDGTLLDIARVPEDVVVPDGLVQTLSALHRACSGAFALISGRSMSTIDALFAPARFAAAGDHGALIRLSGDGGVIQESDPLPVALKLRFQALAREPGSFIEDKMFSVALHYRLVDDPGPLLKRIEEFSAPLSGTGFTVLHGKSVAELKSAAYSKGTALRNFMQAPQFEGRIPVFAGDDITDHYAFEAVAQFHGTNICVGSSYAHAHYTANTPEDIRRWLRETVARNIHVA